ncbi:carbohydrate ABC transporter permease [Mesoaciditoga sp.]
MNLSRKLVPYFLLIPTLLIIGLFIYYPAVLTLKNSLYRVSPFGNRVFFVGAKNFEALLHSPSYQQEAWTTLIFVVVSITLGLIISLLFSLVLNEKVPGVGIFRTIVFSPYAVSPAIAGMLWSFLLNPVVGYVSYAFLKMFGVQSHWLTTYPSALIAIIIATIWQNLGFNIIFFLSGLQGIPDSYYEAAKIDGAGSVRRFFSITLPLLSPITFYLAIMDIIFTMFSSFGIIDIMTQGGPGNSTTTFIYRLYRDGFIYFNSGMASAESMILILIMGVVTFIYFKFVQRVVHYR